jgi:hypothetical protein
MMPSPIGPGGLKGQNRLQRQVRGSGDFERLWCIEPRIIYFNFVLTFLCMSQIIEYPA